MTIPKERPIIFSSPMIRAILDGRKTQTRRIVKPQPEVSRCPYGVPGSKLWVRETWADTNGENGPMISYRACGDRFLVEESYPVDYSLYPGCLFSMWCGDLRRGAEGHAWRSPIHMPRWASRITLELTDVRVERLQDISAKDIIAEGAVDRAHDDQFGHNPVSAFDGCVYLDLKSLWAAGWEKINGKGAWDANPWVWCLSFRRVPQTSVSVRPQEDVEAA